MLNSPLGGRRGIGFGLGRSWQRGGFSPTDIAGLQLWLDFSDASTLFVDAGITPVSVDGDAIYQANDKSGNGINLSQATLGYRPLYKTAIKNGLSIGRLDGSDDRLRDTVGLYATPITIIGIAKNTTGAGYSRLIHLYYGQDSYCFFGSVNDDFATFFGSGGIGNWNDTSANTPLKSILTFKVLSVVNDGTTATPYVNGISQNTKVGTMSNAIGLLIGCSNGLIQFWNGDIAEICIYNSALSDTDRQSVETYLNNKWAIY